MSKSAAIGSLLRRLGICGMVLQARRRGWLRRDTLTILGYHRVTDLPADGFTGEDDNISCPPAVFERELALLARYFTSITFADLGAIRAGKRRPPPNPLIITFDDGYRDNAEVAAPILERHRLTACFFLTTGFLDGEAVPWWDAINRACRGAPGPKLTLTTLGGLELPLDGAGARARAARGLRRHFRGLPAERYSVVLGELARLSGADLNPAGFQGRFMSWDQATALAAAGFEIGAHTRTHPVLSQVESARELEDEVSGARRQLRDRTGQEVAAMAYPVGGPSAINAAVLAAARAAGYAFACTYQDGTNRLARLDCYQLRRIAVGAAATEAQLAVKVAFPWLYRRANA